MNFSRHQFLKTLGYSALGWSLMPKVSSAFAGRAGAAAPFKISLAQWSLHRRFFGDDRGSGEFAEDPLRFAEMARQEFDIEAVEYVNTFYPDYAEDQKLLKELKNVADNEGVRNVLIMCDGEGALGDPDPEARNQAVENHYKWVEAAKYLGCHSIRVNAQSEGSFEEQQKLAADGLSQLSEFGDEHDINILVENHGGLSSNGEWLAGVMERVGHERCGTLPDFGNFNISEEESYDRYKGVEELMPYAKSVSAKTHDFDENGNETNTDYDKMMDIVLSAGFSGYIGIEYEGSELSEPEGIKKTKELLERYLES